MGFAVFLGRPPRLSKRFCFTNMPADVEDHVYGLEQLALERELSNLDQKGWNTLGQIRRSATSRWSMVTAMIREDILEVLLGRNVSNVAQRLECVFDTSTFPLPSTLSCPVQFFLPS